MLFFVVLCSCTVLMLSLSHRSILWHLRGKACRKALVERFLSYLSPGRVKKKGDSLYLGTLKFIFICISLAAGFIVK